MVRIIGSAKIDDYRKIVLEGGVMKSLNVKPGDSLLFFKKEHDSTLSVYKVLFIQIVIHRNDTFCRIGVQQSKDILLQTDGRCIIDKDRIDRLSLLPRFFLYEVHRFRIQGSKGGQKVKATCRCDVFKLALYV